MRCQGCHRENPEATRFCGNCGTPLNNRCVRCGTENPPRFKFCGECGAPLQGGGAVSARFDPSDQFGGRHFDVQA